MDKVDSHNLAISDIAENSSSPIYLSILDFFGKQYSSTANMTVLHCSKCKASEDVRIICLLSCHLSKFWLDTAEYSIGKYFWKLLLNRSTGCVFNCYKHWKFSSIHEISSEEAAAVCHQLFIFHISRAIECTNKKTAASTMLMRWRESSIQLLWMPSIVCNNIL